MSRAEVVRAGYLTKSPPDGRLGQWQKRWFVFADSHRAYPLAPRYVRMEYYQSEEDAEMCRNPKGIIDLKTCSKVTNRENMRGFKHVFDVWTAERRYHLVADNELDKRDWIDTLNTTLFTPSSSTTAPDPSQQQQQKSRPVALTALPSSGDGSVSTPEKERPGRPLPPVPSNTAINRPLPPTPPERSSPATHYRRLSGQGSTSPSGICFTQKQHQMVRQVKSSGTVQEGPDCYQLSLAQDYENLEAEKHIKYPRGPRDYENLEQDYDDTVSGEGCVYEDPVSQPAPISSSLPPAPVSKPKGKGAGNRRYVNVESSSASTDAENYSLLEAGPIQHPTTSDDYSVLEAVRPQPAAREGDYSRLELTGQLDLGPPKKPPYSGRTARDVDYENLGHVAHPGTGEYSSLQF